MTIRKACKARTSKVYLVTTPTGPEPPGVGTPTHVSATGDDVAGHITGAATGIGEILPWRRLGAP